MKVDLTPMEWQVVASYLGDAMALHTRLNHPDDAANIMLLINQIDSQTRPAGGEPATSEWPPERPHPNDYRD